MTPLTRSQYRGTPRVCPFCGARPAVYKTDEVDLESGVVYLVACTDVLCQVRPQVTAERSANEAILRWNLTPAKVREHRKMHSHFKKIQDWKVLVPDLKSIPWRK